MVRNIGSVIAGFLVVGQLVAYPAVWFAVTRLLGDEAKAGTS